MRSGFVSKTRADEIARQDEQPLFARCAFCTWEFSGTVAQGRAAAQKHRFKKHPEAVATRRRGRRHLSSFRQNNPDREELAEIEVERKRRAKLIGVDID